LPCLFFWHQQVLWRAWPLPRQRAILQKFSSFPPVNVVVQRFVV
jgi:hypothetical protein